MQSDALPILRNSVYICVYMHLHIYVHEYMIVYVSTYVYIYFHGKNYICYRSDLEASNYEYLQ